jgi:hypothetical protein
MFLRNGYTVGNQFAIGITPKATPLLSLCKRVVELIILEIIAATQMGASTHFAPWGTGEGYSHR